jgi:peptidoglycan hydrolase-like protein with peptidoglycan-binding domain
MVHATRRFLATKSAVTGLAAAIALLACLVSGAGIALADDTFLVRDRGDGRIYALAGGRKRLVLSDAVSASYGWSTVVSNEADSALLANIPNIRAIKADGSPAVYDITAGARHPIASEEEFLGRGFSWDEVLTVGPIELESYPLEGTGTVPLPISAPPPSIEEPAAVPAPAEVASTPVPIAVEIAEPLIIAKITRARELLHAAAPLYPQQKRSSSWKSFTSGAEGTHVEMVQRKLQELGFFPATIEPNGVFGPTTLASVKAFQKSQGIEQNGIVGPMTTAALREKGLAVPADGALVSQWREVVPVDREVLLAAWNPSNDDFKLIQVTLTTGTKPKVQSRTPGFTVAYRGGSGVNVQYAITSPAGYQVLADRFPIFDAANGKVGTFPADEEVYIPYSDTFLAPDIVAWGRKHLDDAVAAAMADLRAKGVQSLSGKGLVGDLTDTNELKNIAIIEHVDATAFKKAADPSLVINKVFAILATNGEDAYRFAGSSAGALGLAQFIEKTYVGIVKRFPSAQLIPDFRRGMADHVNAFKAMALYNDATGVTLENYVSQKLVSDPVALAAAMADVRAAAYNGGSARVKTALGKFGDQWQVAVSSRYGLRLETRQYLEKFKVVKDFLARL